MALLGHSVVENCYEEQVAVSLSALSRGDGFYRAGGVAWAICPEMTGMAVMPRYRSVDVSLAVGNSCLER